MSKGSSPRPFSVSQETFGNNFDAIFRKKPDEREETKGIPKCGCGNTKNPQGYCDGSHSQSSKQRPKKSKK
jgi:CDGSH-type Zn-finger protein